MNCNQIIFSKHAITRMFARKLSKELVIEVLKKGESIATYPDDQPLPGRLLLGFDNKRPVHLVVAYDESEKTCIIITAYVPDLSIWEPDFKKRRSI